MTTGGLARQIARMEESEIAVLEDSFMAGLLHDSGKLVLAVNLPDRYREVLDCAQSAGVSLWEVERRALGTTHAEVGAYLMGLWGLPDPIVEAIAFHHSPRQCPGRVLTALAAVHVADALVQVECTDEKEIPGGIDADYIAELGRAERMPEWREYWKIFTVQGAVDA